MILDAYEISLYSQRERLYKNLNYFMVQFNHFAIF